MWKPLSYNRYSINKLAHPTSSDASSLTLLVPLQGGRVQRFRVDRSWTAWVWIMPLQPVSQSAEGGSYKWLPQKVAVGLSEVIDIGCLTQSLAHSFHLENVSSHYCHCPGSGSSYLSAYNMTLKEKEVGPIALATQGSWSSAQ